MALAGHRVEAVLVEERAAIAAEYYAAVLNDPASKGPLAMFSPEGGMDIEEVAGGEAGPGAPRTGRHPARPRSRVRAGHARRIRAGDRRRGGRGGARRPLPGVPRQRCGAPGGEPSRPARGRAARRPRLQAHPRRFRSQAPGGARGGRQPGPDDGARGARRRARAQVHRARRRHRGHRERRGAHHDHDGRHHPPGRAAREFSRDRGRGVHEGEARPRAPACQPPGQVPRRQLLRRVCADRRHDRRRCSTRGRRCRPPFRSSSACAARGRQRRGRCSASASG